MSIENEVFRDYLYDLGFIFKEEALLAKKELEENRGTHSEGYYTGRLIAWHTVISIMQQQALGFNIPFADLRLDDVVPERDII
jgi:hypothetical protein